MLYGNLHTTVVTKSDYDIQVQGTSVYVKLILEGKGHLERIKKLAVDAVKAWDNRDPEFFRSSIMLLAEQYYTKIGSGRYMERNAYDLSVILDVPMLKECYKRVERDKLRSGSAFKQLMYSFGFGKREYDDHLYFEIVSYSDWMADIKAQVDAIPDENLYEYLYNLTMFSYYDTDYFFGVNIPVSSFKEVQAAFTKRDGPEDYWDIEDRANSIPRRPSPDAYGKIVSIKDVDDTLAKCYSSAQAMPEESVYTIPRSLALTLNTLKETV